MNVQVTRWDPETDSRPHLQLYQVPLPADGTHTVMDVLDYIYEKLDGTLSYYRHSVCNQGICGRCAACERQGAAGLYLPGLGRIARIWPEK